MVCDPRQRIYDRRVVLSNCGIHVQGRIRKLRRNYRTTELLRKSAVQLLGNESFQDLAGEAVNSLGDFSCRRGVPPQVEFLTALSDGV